MEMSKIFISPSWNDAFPNVFLEAMSYDCSLTGTMGTGAEDIIIKGDYGCLIEKGDTNALV